jgi:hypothetical protein
MEVGCGLKLVSYWNPDNDTQAIYVTCCHSSVDPKLFFNQFRKRRLLPVSRWPICQDSADDKGLSAGLSVQIKYRADQGMPDVRQRRPAL